MSALTTWQSVYARCGINFVCARYFAIWEFFSCRFVVCFRSQRSTHLVVHLRKRCTRVRSMGRLVVSLKGSMYGARTQTSRCSNEVAMDSCLIRNNKRHAYPALHTYKVRAFAQAGAVLILSVLTSWQSVYVLRSLPGNHCV